MNSFNLIVSLILALSTAYFFFILYLFNHKGPKKYPLSALPKISVLVAFRNEEKNIFSCCEALSKLDYPEDKLEILMLNDQSTDKSSELVQDYVNGKDSFHLINIENELNDLKAKMNVLAQGIKISKGEFVFITDADCAPSPGWIKTTLQYFDPQIGLISGFTILTEEKAKYFSLLQTIDWIFLQGLAYSSSNSNRPITVMGNNLSFRRSIYDQVGGFESIGFSVTEDHALMKAVLENTNQTVKYIRDKEATIFSLPVANIRLL